MSEIARKYIEANAARKVAEAAFEAALTKQFGNIWKGMDAGKKEHNEETAAAFTAMSEAIDASFVARSHATANGGDYALYIGS